MVVVGAGSVVVVDDVVVDEGRDWVVDVPGSVELVVVEGVEAAAEQPARTTAATPAAASARNLGDRLFAPDEIHATSGDWAKNLRAQELYSHALHAALSPAQMSPWDGPAIATTAAPKARPGPIVPTPRRSCESARAQGVKDPRVLDALREVRRSRFVPPDLRREAGLDYALPIGNGQTTSQPSLIALMLEALELEPEDKVLEIGTGFGYETALLSRLARQVFSVERIDELAQAARSNLEAEGISNVQVVTGDGTLGLGSAAPFDGIVIAAAYLNVPAPLADQLAPGRNLVMPVGDGSGDLVKVFQRQGDKLVERRVLCGARFVPLFGENGFELPGPLAARRPDGSRSVGDAGEHE